MKDYEMISVIAKYNDKVIIKNNPTNYRLIGTGAQGAVFKLSNEQCIKIYANKKVAELEADAYERIKISTICPKLYKAGPNYIIIEYIEGLTLRQYLEEKKYISESITKQILELLREMKKLGFTVIDFGINNVMVTTNNRLKLIDLANVFSKERKYPTQLFKELKHIDLLGMFINQVKKINFNTYLQMKNAETKIFGIKLNH